jgi:hypothetical protein
VAAHGFDALIRTHGATTTDGSDTFFRAVGAAGVYLSIDFDTMIPAKPCGSRWLLDNTGSVHRGWPET